MRLSESVNTILPVCAPRTEPPSVRVAYLCDFPLWATHTHARIRASAHTVPEHLKHELLFFKKRLGKKLPLKRTASYDSSNCYLLQAINEDRDADFCSALSLFLSLASADIIVHFNFCTDTGGKNKFGFHIFLFFFLFFFAAHKFTSGFL